MNLIKQPFSIMEKHNNDRLVEVRHILKRFYDSGMRCAELTDWQKWFKTQNACTCSFNLQIDNLYPDKICIFNRKGILYLVNVEDMEFDCGNDDDGWHRRDWFRFKEKEK